MRFATNYFSAFATALELAQKLESDVYIWMDRKTWNVSAVEPRFLPEGGFEIVSAI
jgi:hypothetical protein